MGGWRHTIVYDDSLNMMWRDYLHEAQVNWQNSPSRGSRSSGPSNCAFSMRLVLQPGGHVRLHSDAPVRDYAQLTLQLWARTEMGRLSAGRCTIPRRRLTGWKCSAALCISMWKSWAGEASALMIPLCAFGSIGKAEWSRLSLPASVFAPSFGEAFDEVVLLAGTAAPVTLPARPGDA